MSARRKVANQANARRSTGPKTASGKRAVRLNGIKHGLRSKDVILPGEDPNEFTKFRQAIFDDFAPSGAMETFLTDRVVTAAWRLSRSQRAEVALFEWRARELNLQKLHSDGEEIGDGVNGDVESAVRAEDSDCVFVQDVERTANVEVLVAKTFDSLNRYATTLERSFYRELNELQRFQEAHRSRQATADQPPLATSSDPGRTAPPARGPA